MTWNLIQAINAGASRKTCSLGEGSVPFDARPYGTALEQEGFPYIRQWSNGQWSAESKADCYQFLRAVVERRSVPMLAVLAIARQKDPENFIGQWIEALSPKERASLTLTAKIAIGEPEWDEFFKGWE